MATGAELATQLAVQGQNGPAIYAPVSGGHCCGTTHCAAAHHLENCAGAHHLAAFAGLSGHPQMSQASLQAASIPIESAANDLALQVANLRNPQRLRAIRHCLEDSRMSHIGPMMTPAPPPQLATPAPEHAHDQSKPAHRRHNHRAEQKKVLIYSLTLTLTHTPSHTQPPTHPTHPLTHLLTHPPAHLLPTYSCTHLFIRSLTD